VAVPDGKKTHRGKVSLNYSGLVSVGQPCRWRLRFGEGKEYDWLQTSDLRLQTSGFRILTSVHYLLSTVYYLQASMSPNSFALYSFRSRTAPENASMEMCGPPLPTV
jgi:hypothetical protein